MSGRAHRLLVVDDNEVNRDMLQRRLQRRGYEVDAAEDGRSALQLARQGVYDLVVLDIMMPGMSGIEVLKLLREQFTRAELPVLMATARTDSEDMVQALSLGANDYVTKPIDFPVVLARIEAHLQTRLQAPSMPAPAVTIAADGHVPVGTVLGGRYEVDGALGEGGHAVVLRARQLSTGQAVAVKLLHSMRAGEMLDKHRFEREMKTIGELRHPNIVRLIDFGELAARVEEPKEWVERSGEVNLDDLASDQEPPETRTVVRRLPYIVMELLEGETLASWLEREAPVAPRDAVELMLPVISAVSSAHRLGIVHRDLKPPNIFVSRGLGDRPHPSVLDFGIAKPVDEKAAPDSSIEYVGTPEYMAPEVARRGSEAADERSDQYALGVILYELLTGHRPFGGTSVLERLHDSAPPSIRASVIEVSGALEATILRALDPDPERRFSSLDAFGKALLRSAPDGVRAQWTSSFSVRTDPPPPPPPAPAAVTVAANPSTRDAPAALRPIAWLMIALGGLLALAAAVVWWLRGG